MMNVAMLKCWCLARTERVICCVRVFGISELIIMQIDCENVIADDADGIPAVWLKNIGISIKTRHYLNP